MDAPQVQGMTGGAGGLVRAGTAPVSVIAFTAVFVLLSIGLRNLALLAGGDYAARSRVEEIARRKHVAPASAGRGRTRATAGGLAALVQGLRAGGRGLRGGLGRLLERIVGESRLDAGLASALERAGLNLTPGEFLAACALCGILCAAPGLAWGGGLSGVLLGVLGLCAPASWMKHREAARLKQFDKQLPDALTMVANSIRSGYSLLQSLDLVAAEMPAPVSVEFGRVVREAGLNIPLEESLSGMLARVRSDDLDLVVTAVLIHREVGGNLSEVLDQIAYTIRERARILGEVRALTAQGRMSGIVIGLLPVVLCVLLTTINRSYMEPFFRHPLGRAMLGLAALMQAIGAVVVRKIVNIRV